MDISAIKDALDFFVDLVEGITKVFKGLPEFFQSFKGFETVKDADGKESITHNKQPFMGFHFKDIVPKTDQK
ncbi:MAG: hypothetical protein ACHEUT_11585 [Corynebacterium pyruviciproducens]|uniref:hypothetical protein n=1 Tax=Corynebacterium pyruviciproducens TaxID=598660 RepID=UPI0039835DF2